MKLLKMKPEERMTAEEALRHPWIQAAPDNKLDNEVIKRLKGFQAQNRLKKAIGKVLAKNMSDTDVETLQRAFKQFDINGDGRLSADEIKAMLSSIGREPSDAAALMAQFDDDKSGNIDFEEFKQMQGAGMVGDQKTAEQLFLEFDKDSACRHSGHPRHALTTRRARALQEAALCRRRRWRICCTFQPRRRTSSCRRSTQTETVKSPSTRWAHTLATTAGAYSAVRVQWIKAMQGGVANKAKAKAAPKKK
jgi:hypothetical protein